MDGSKSRVKDCLQQSKMFFTLLKFVCNAMNLILLLFLIIFNKYGIDHLRDYSQRPKTERSVFGKCRKPNKLVFELVCLVFGSFGSFYCCSDFGHAKLDRFIYKGGHKNYFLYIKRSSLVAV